jgi:hypothetical protein
MHTLLAHIAERHRRIGRTYDPPWRPCCRLIAARTSCAASLRKLAALEAEASNAEVGTVTEPARAESLVKQKRQ